MKRIIFCAIIVIPVAFLFFYYPISATVGTGQIYISWPDSGSSVTGKVALTAATLESAQIVGVQFLVDGAAVGTEILKIPFKYDYDFSGIANGPHTVSAKGRSLNGSYITSSAITVNVSNPVPLSINNLSVATGPTSVVVSWETSRPATFQLEYGTNYSYGQTVSSSFLATSRKVTLARLGPESTYHYRVLVWDKDYMAANSGDRTFATTALKSAWSIPTGTLSSPQAGSVVGGNVTLVATPDSGVDTPVVQFQVDNADVGEKISVSPFLKIFDSSVLVNGNHTFSAVVWDKAGNSGWSNALTMAVGNSATPSGTTWIDSRTARLVNASGTFFLISSGQRYGITDPGVLKSFGFEFKDATVAGAADIALPEGKVLAPGDGSLVKKAGDPTVWFSTGGKKFGFTSADVFTGLGFSWSNVREISASVLDSLAVGSPLNSASARHLSGVFVNSGGTIYRMEEVSRRGISSLGVFNSWNIDGDFSAVVPANAADLAVPVGANLEMRNFN